MFTIGLTLTALGVILMFLTCIRGSIDVSYSLSCFNPLVLLYIIAAQLTTAGVVILVLYEAGVLKIIPTE